MYTKCFFTNSNIIKVHKNTHNHALCAILKNKQEEKKRCCRSSRKTVEKQLIWPLVTTCFFYYRLWLKVVQEDSCVFFLKETFLMVNTYIELKLLTYPHMIRSTKIDMKREVNERKFSQDLFVFSWSLPLKCIFSAIDIHMSFHINESTAWSKKGQNILLFFIIFCMFKRGEKTLHDHIDSYKACLNKLYRSYFIHVHMYRTGKDSFLWGKPKLTISVQLQQVQKLL